MTVQLSQPTQQDAVQNTLVFIDAAIADYSALALGVLPGAEVAMLDPRLDGVEQITTVLKEYVNLSSIQIISHGAPGSVQLGNTYLSTETLVDYSLQLQQWRTALAEEADILLYGCNVAATEAADGRNGVAFINHLSLLTGATVAASNSLTGAKGNWNLEVSTGAVKSTPAFHPEVMANYQGTLATYYVSGTGSDSNDGSSTSQAFRSLQKAADLVQAGDTVLVMDGTYTSGSTKATLAIRNKQGTEENPITFKAYPGANPVIDSQGASAISISGSSYVVVDGFTVNGPLDSITMEYAESQKDNSSNPLINGSAISIQPSYDGTGQNIVNYSNHITISNNTISKFPGGGIGSNMSDYITIENNTISETSLYSTLGTSAISILHSHNSDSNTTDYKFVIQGNTIHDNIQLIPWIQATKVSEGHGIILDSNRNNEVDSDVKESAYEGKFLIANNTVYDNGGFGVTVFQSENADIVNNTLYHNSSNLDVKGEISVINSGNVRAENNIMSARDGSRSNLIYQSSDVIFDNNLTYNSSTTFQSTSPAGATMGSGQSYVDSSANNAAATNETSAKLQNIIEQDPQFVDPENGDFTLKAGSLAIDAGSSDFSSVVSTDADGTTRRDGDGINGVETDIGAHEYTGTPTLTPASLFIAVKDSIKSEGNSGTTPFTFTITRSGDTTSAVSVDYAVTGSGSKTANAADFGGTLPGGTINFAANETSKTLTINVQGDTTAEPDEGFTVTLSNASSGATIATATATGTIQNEDSATIEAKAVSTYRSEGDTGTTPFTFNVIRSGDVSGTTKVSYTVSSGTGTNPASADDIEGGFYTGTVTFLPNETSKQVAINVKGDLTDESNETFLVVLSDPDKKATFTNSAIGATIVNDDSIPVVTIAATDADASETGSDPGQFTVTRTGSTTDSLVVTYYISGTATNLADYTDATTSKTLAKNVTIPAGSSSATITIAPKDDTVAEGNETVILTIDSTSRYKIGTDSTGTVTIADNETGTPTTLAIAATSASKAEGNSGTTPYTFTVTRSGDTTSATSVNYAVTGSGTNAAKAADFGGTLPTGTISFAAGETSKVITLNASGDTTVESDEGFTVTLSSPTGGATLTTATATGTIQNDDVATTTTDLAIAAISASKAEGNSGTTPYTFTVTRSGDTTSATSVDYAVTGSGSNAANAADFSGTLPTGTVTFAAGETSKVITVNASGDTTVESDEGFTVTLSSPTGGATLTTATASGTIQNDDTASSGNTAPTLNSANAVPDLTAAGKQAFSYTVDANAFTDADGDTLSYTATLGDGSSLPTWLTFNSTTRTFSGTPTNANAGTLTIDLTASDGNGGSSKDTFTLTVNAATNQSPTLNSAYTIPDLTTTATNPFSYTVNPKTFADPDGDTLTYQATLEDGSSLPSWLTFNAATGTFSGTPTSASAGTSTIVLSASDGNGGTIKDTFTLTVQPLIPSTPSSSTLNGTDLSETLVGKTTANQIYGWGGQDLLTGGADQDQLYGGDGNDRLWGHAGNDTLYGDSGNDQLWGNAGNDTLYGGVGDDQLFGDAGADWLDGGSGNDVLTGGGGADTFALARGQGIKIIRDFEVGTDTIALGSGFNLSEALLQQRGSQTWVIDNSLHQVVAKLDSVNASLLQEKVKTTFVTV
ncbi:MAG: DUF4347 domain-containing protein [Stenomitos rutilans HA7619-LM2]|jgi:Ca2+-binding RTX toxin-like protein|nr:DUF4347 domain-containing protein [Stenomitos rutilans HA7619-LM2]